MTLAAGVLAALCAGPLAAQADNACDAPGDAPDVVVGDLGTINVYGVVNGVAGLSVRTTSCNIGTCWLDWFADDQRHPVIAQNLYRFEDGRFEQLGMSWVKHGYNALNQELCSTGCLPTDGTHLGVNCADTYSANSNGFQPGMGPRSGVNAATGALVWPFPTQGDSGDAIYKRLQVREADLDPAQHPGARYFIEAHYVAADDAAAGMAANNASHREVAVTVDPLDVEPIDETVRGLPAITAWGRLRPGVVDSTVDVPGDGRLFVASAAAEVSAGIWEYEYAVFNLDSHRSVGGLAVPLPGEAGVTDVGFTDVDYHGGEPYSGADWPGSVEGRGVTRRLAWRTDPEATDPDANAIRWSTMYTFRFRTGAPPAAGEIELALFRAGTPPAVAAGALVPLRCDDDGVCDPGEDCDTCPGDCVGAGGGACCGDGVCEAGETSCGCAVDCGAALATESDCADGLDDDCDGDVDCADPDCCLSVACPAPTDADGDGVACDCDDADPDVWAVPGEVGGIEVVLEGGGASRVLWSPVADPGATSVGYDVLRSPDGGDFAGSVCVADGDPGGAGVLDTAVPAAGALRCYLVRATNGCPAGLGPLGAGSAGQREEPPACPAAPAARRSPRTAPAVEGGDRLRRGDRGDALGP